MPAAMAYSKLPPLPTIRDLLKLYRLHARKQLSQNFLLDLKLTNKIVNQAGRIEDGEVCEVGPGPGSITRSILGKSPSKLIVIEKDKRFEHLLKALAEVTTTNMSVIINDVLSFNMSTLFSETYRKEWDEKPPNIHLIGNLPFNVGTPLIIKWLKDISLRRNAWTYGRVKMTLTFQKEVGERMVAPPLSKERCRLSVICQNYCEVHLKQIIYGTAFLPPPKVDAAVVHLVPRITPLIDLKFELVEKFLRTVFNMRRKFAERGASRLYPPYQRDELCKELFKAADVDPQTRCFSITNEEFRRLCITYKFQCDRDPQLFGYDFRARKDALGEESDLMEDDEEEEDDDDEEDEEKEKRKKKQRKIGKKREREKEDDVFNSDWVQ